MMNLNKISSFFKDNIKYVFILSEKMLTVQLILPII